MNFMAFETEQKLRGGYYTPEDIANFLTRWVAQDDAKQILEPSCGDGAFFPSIAKHIPDAIITAFELEPIEAAKAQARGTGATVHQRDFLGWAIETEGSRFDAIVGNPPFIRYQ